MSETESNELVPQESTYETTYTETTEPSTPPVQEVHPFIDYTPVIYDAANNICACILFGCLCICGVLAAIRLWGVRPS